MTFEAVGELPRKMVGTEPDPPEGAKDSVSLNWRDDLRVVRESIAETSSDEFIRSFMAVEIAEEARRKFAEVRGLAEAVNAHVGWVKPEGIHLTLAFLGDQPAGALDAVRTAMDVVASDEAPFAYEIGGLGFFGNPRSPRVIWAGVREPSGRLTGLQTRLAAELLGLGIALDERPFVPHITLARVRSSRNVEEWLRAIAPAREWEFGRVSVARVVLVASRLTPAGPVYRLLHAAPFLRAPCS